MGSFALWYEEQKNNNISNINNEKCQVHINFWLDYLKKSSLKKLCLKFNKSNSDTPMIDFGIMLENINNINKVKLYVPFKINKDEVKDLGGILNNKNTLDAVFNENCKITNSGAAKKILVTKPNGDEFCLYELTDEINVYEKYDGTMIELNVSTLKDSKHQRYYIRFRLQTKLLYSIVKKYTTRDKVFKSAISYNQALSFRFNDFRTLSPSLRQNMESQRYFNIDKIHFLLLTHTDTDIISQSYISERELENNIWDSYVGKELQENVAAYHWKFPKQSDSNIADINLFIKMKINKCNWFTIIIYILVLGLISVFFNLSSNLIWWRLGFGN